MNYTVKQISEASGISTQAVYQHIKRSGIEPLCTRHKTAYYSEDDAVKIMQIIDPDADISKLHIVVNACKEVAKHGKDEYIQALKDQISAKDKEIEELKADRQAKETDYKELAVKYSELAIQLVTLTTNQQELLARQQQLIAKVNKPSAADDKVIDSYQVTEHKPEKKSFWQKLFRK